MTSTLRWTSIDLKTLPDYGRRYEISDGELFVSKQPHFYHQLVCTNITTLLANWNSHNTLGQPIFAPGLIFADDDDVVPDVAWLSNDRLTAALGDDGKLRLAPDLIVEALSPGAANQSRDREAKLKLYSRRGVLEYWIVDWLARSVDVFRRGDSELALVGTLTKSDLLESPLLLGFSVLADQFFAGVT